jgi:hypothetical protein
MAQYEQLDVLDVNAPAAADKQPQQRHERELDERQGHRAILSGARATPASNPHQSFGTLQAGGGMTTTLPMLSPRSTAV